MGDAADASIEDGELGWLAHLEGDCGYGCQYCADEEDEKEIAEETNGRG